MNLFPINCLIELIFLVSLILFFWGTYVDFSDLEKNDYILLNVVYFIVIFLTIIIFIIFLSFYNLFSKEIFKNIFINGFLQMILFLVLFKWLIPSETKKWENRIFGAIGSFIFLCLIGSLRDYQMENYNNKKTNYLFTGFWILLSLVLLIIIIIKWK
jgi:heme/copper-type cytochrome/quinol oxidase subunit 4